MVEPYAILETTKLYRTGQESLTPKRFRLSDAFFRVAFTSVRYITFTPSFVIWTCLIVGAKWKNKCRFCLLRTYVGHPAPYRMYDVNAVAHCISPKTVSVSFSRIDRASNGTFATSDGPNFSPAIVRRKGEKLTCEYVILMRRRPC